jgi:hypothetical protein
LTASTTGSSLDEFKTRSVGYEHEARQYNIKIQLLSQSKCVSITTINLLMLFREIIVVYSEDDTKSMSTLIAK